MRNKAEQLHFSWNYFVCLPRGLKFVRSCGASKGTPRKRGRKKQTLFPCENIRVPIYLSLVHSSEIFQSIDIFELSRSVDFGWYVVCFKFQIFKTIKYKAQQADLEESHLLTWAIFQISRFWNIRIWTPHRNEIKLQTPPPKWIWWVSLNRPLLFSQFWWIFPKFWLDCRNVHCCLQQWMKSFSV